MSGCPRTLALLAALFLAARPGLAHQAGVPDGRRVRESRELGASRTEALRARWRTLPEEERGRLESRLQELERLPPQERRDLLERARALRERERSYFDSQPEELRSRFEELGPERGRELWERHLRERFREQGRELRQRLPEDVRRRLDQEPGEVRRVLERLSRERERISRSAVRRLGTRLELPERELRELEGLPVDERIRQLQVLERRLERAPGAPRQPRTPGRSAGE